MSENTYEQDRALIRAMAEADLAEHVITPEGEGRWRFAKPGTGICAARIIVAPFNVIVVGDLGEAVLYLSDRDALEWLRRADDREYMLGKIRACSDGRVEFYVGEALRIAREHLNERAVAEIEELQRAGELHPNTWADVLCAADADSELHGLAFKPSTRAIWIVELLIAFSAALKRGEAIAATAAAIAGGLAS